MRSPESLLQPAMASALLVLVVLLGRLCSVTARPPPGLELRVNNQNLSGESSDTVVFSNHDNVTIVCFVEAYGKMNVTWWEAEKQVVGQRLCHENFQVYSVVNLSNLSLDDDGRILTCRFDHYSNITRQLQLRMHVTTQTMASVSSTARSHPAPTGQSATSQTKDYSASQSVTAVTQRTPPTTNYIATVSLIVGTLNVVVIAGVVLFLVIRFRVCVRNNTHVPQHHYQNVKIRDEAPSTEEEDYYYPVITPDILQEIRKQQNSQNGTTILEEAPIRK